MNVGRPVVPPATIGMLGGGQLGRYALMSARRMGYRSVLVDPDPHAPAGRVADRHLVAAFDDPEALDELGRTCDVVTTEFENPPASSLAELATRTLVYPSASAVAVAQDRIREKAFLADAGLPVGAYAAIDGPIDAMLPGSLSAITFPARLKTARMGYDGKGQVVVESADQLAAAWTSLGAVACVLEAALTLDVELSVVCARSADGSFVAYDVAENVHVDGVLDLTVVPARVPATLRDAAVELAAVVAARLDYVGVLAVELFVVDGRLLVNEIAPRPHNSGHWTLDGARVDQFAQQIRAVCGVALGDTTRTAGGVAMVNLLGDRWAAGEPNWAAALADPATALHLYGKSAARPGRKMGHLTVWRDDPDAAAAAALTARAALTQ